MSQKINSLLNVYGNVGIGSLSSTPLNKADIYGAIAIGTTYAFSVTAPTSGAAIEGQVLIGTSSDIDGSKLTVSTANPEALYVTSSSVSGTNLTLRNTSTGGKAWQLISRGNSLGSGDLAVHNFTGSTDPVIIGGATGYVGIGIGSANSPGALLDLGLAGTTLGVMRLAGSTSGNVTIQPAAVAGSWTLTLPATGGTNGYALVTDGSGVTTWAQPASVANPTASVGLTAVNGVATTSMRSDAAPPLDVSIAPTWTGYHTFKPSNSATAWQVQQTDATPLVVADTLNFRLGVGAGSSPGALLDLGLAGTRLGVLRLAGSTSGNVTVEPAATAGTWTLTLPTTAGSNGYALTTNGSGITTWTSITSSVTLSGDVTGSAGSNTVVKLQNRTLASTLPSNGQAIVWNNSLTQWEPGTVVTGTGSVVTNLSFSEQGSDPATPASGYQIIEARDDRNIYVYDSTGRKMRLNIGAPLVDGNGNLVLDGNGDVVTEY